MCIRLRDTEPIPCVHEEDHNENPLTSVCGGTYFLAHADRTIEVHAGENVSNLQFSFGKVRVHTVLFHIVSSHRSLLPSEKFGVSIEAPERDALVYHLMQTRNINGEFPAGHLPPDK